MPLSSGEQLSHYKILSMIGKGGMGEVYLGTDTRLDRSVAIKVSSREFNDRFEREARAISALNHPNICTLYDVGPNYLVMEYIEGDSLSKLLERGPLPLDKALTYAAQIVDALSAAHAKGIVHRDLKPGNIMVTKNGAKVLDFGLAKLSHERLSTESGASIETVTEPITKAGAILGTLYYMAPEQVEGKETDERSDIFSFGAVFYEMVTGQRAFTGETQAAVLAAILKDQPPPMSQRQPATPRALERVVRRCLEKKPEDRWRSAHDLKPAIELIDLDAPAPTSASSSVPVQALSPEPKARPWFWPAIATGLLALVALGFGGYRYWQANSFTDLPLVRQDVNLGLDVELMPPVTFATNFAISPDGARIAYIARPTAGGPPRLYTRRLDRSNAIELPGSENPRHPFFSPDGEWLGFSSQQKLYKISVDGGALLPLMDLRGQFQGAAWGKGMMIVAQGGLPLVRIADTGGSQPTPLGPFLPGEIIQSSPQLLPGDESVFFATNLGNETGLPDPNKSRMDVISLQDQKRTVLQTNTAVARYVPSRGATGHLLYTSQGGLYAVPFHPGKLEKQGPAVPVLSDMLIVGNTVGKYSVSETGTLIYQKGSPQATVGALETLQWIDNTGKAEPILAEPADYDSARVSPDGTRLAIAVLEGARQNIRVLDWSNGRTTSLTFGDADYYYPAWTPDGKHVVFTRSDGGLYFAPADGSGQRQQLTQSVATKAQIASSFSPDGTRLAFAQRDSGTSQIWTVSISRESGQLRAGKIEKFVDSEFVDTVPKFSPDGKWLAYASTRSGGPQILVRPAVGQAGQWVIPAQTANFPMWSRSSQDLIYTTLVGQGTPQIMAVHYSTQGDAFVLDKPRVWLASVPSNPHDLSPDGKRLLAIVQQGAAAAPLASREIVFLQNFFDELRRRAPVK
ncbi:MAG: protein kinase [Acidobacteriota bacterium]